MASGGGSGGPGDPGAGRGGRQLASRASALRIFGWAVMARRIPRDESLARVHGVGALFSAAYGNVGSSIYYALGVTAAFALGLTPVAFVIAGLIFMATAATYAEATVMYPEAGGSSSFARHAFNELISFFAAWGQMLNYIITVAISAFFVPHYLAVFWSPLGESPGDILGGIGVIAFLAALNIKGTQESSRLNLILAIADLLTQIILVAIGLVLVFNPDILVDNVHLGVAPSWSDFLLGIAVGMIAYTGIETISNMSEEAKDAPKTVPKGVGLTVLAVLGLYALLPLIALSAMPVHQLADGSYATDLGSKFADDPVLGIVENLGLGAGMTEVLRYYVGVLAAVILLIATNAGLIGVSRLTFSIAHIAVIKLRQRYPDKEREWKPPGSVRAFGFDLPVTAVFGGLGTFAAWIVVMALNPRTLVIGALWMLLGTTIYLFYRRSLGLSPIQTHKVLLPEPLGVEEIEYKSVLVAFEDDEPFNEQTMVTAVKLAAKRRRALHVIAIVTVPNHLPLDAPLGPQEEEAQSKIEQAKLIGGLRVSGHIHRVRPNQAGHSIAEEAQQLKASALVMGLRYRNGAPLYGKTLQTVLAERPCRVIVVGKPEAARAAKSPAGPPVSPGVGAPA